MYAEFCNAFSFKGNMGGYTFILFFLDVHQRCEVVAQRMRSQTRWSHKRNRGRTNSEPRNVATRNVVEGDAQSL